MKIAIALLSLRRPREVRLNGDALLGTENLEDFMRHISQPGVYVPEEWQVEELAKATRHADIILVNSGIPAETLSKCFVTPANSIEAGIALALAKHGNDASILAIPRGPYVIPYV